MIFDAYTNQLLQQGIGLAEVREQLASDPPNSLYAVQYEAHDENQDRADGDVCFFYTKNPPMIGYRYQIPPASDDAVHPQFFMNDIALLRLEESDAEQIRDRQLEAVPRRKRLISLDNYSKLGSYIKPNPPVNIFIKGFKGRLVENKFKMLQLRQEGSSYYLLFTLDNDG